jgi:two-component system sensor histidine kinase EvgS
MRLDGRARSPEPPRRFRWAGLSRLTMTISLLALLCIRLPAMADGSPALFDAKETAWIKAHPVVRIVVDPYLRPLEFIEAGRFQGLTADYMAAIGKISGLRFELTQVPNYRIAAALEAGDIDAIPAVSPAYTAFDIRKNLIISAPYYVGSTIIVTRGNSELIFDPRKLDGKTVALKGGGAYENMLRNTFPNVRLYTVETPADALFALASGKADAAIGIDAVLLPILNERYRNELNVSGTLADAPPVMSVGTRRQLPELASIMEKSLGALTARQTDAIDRRWTARNNYGPPSWAQILRHRWFEIGLVMAALLALVMAAQQQRRARRAAEQSEQAKARFLAVMSHEIRTPMNAILSSIELLARSKLTRQQRQLSDLAGTASEALLELLDDVLDLSKLEARRLTLAQVPTDLTQLARSVVDIAALQARAKNLDIVLQADLPAATDLLLDPARIRQILVNLTSNAVKFTERGIVKVGVALEGASTATAATAATAADGADDAHAPDPSRSAVLLLTVSDTGIGVPVERQKDLFRPYHQAHRTSTRRFGGTGLGLAICRELCELMHGEIRFDSTAGIGSTVTCRIPVELIPAQNTASDENEHNDGKAKEEENGNGVHRDDGDAEAGAVGQSPHILVVEDHPGNRMVLRQQLTQLGYRFTMVEDGLSALEQTARQSFALMLLDCYLPDIDGYTVASRQRAYEASRTGPHGGGHLPIIAISAAVDQEHLDACMQSGMDGTLRKPLRLAALENLLNGWCGPGQPPTQAAPAVNASGNAAHPESIDSAASADLSTVFMQTMRDDLAQLEQAVRQQAQERAARIAHRMRGAALVCKWPRIAAHSLTIEQELKGAADFGKVAAAIAELHLALESDTSK